jgi:type IV secretory pathway VirD2 relaxase
MEAITGYSFHWMAATHTDTEHPHAHLLINGTDKNGRSET